MRITVRLSLAVAGLSALVSLSGLLGCSTSGSASSTPVTPPSSAAPTVTSISPTKILAGAASTTLTVTGTGFTSETGVQVGGVVEPTTYASSTQVSAAVPASQLASGGMLSIIVLNGSSTSAAGAAVNLEVDNPSPEITSFVPASFATGASAASVSVIGTGFVPATTVQIGGSARNTTYVSSTEVDVVLTATDLASGGSLSLVAVNPTPGGGSSAASSIAVNNPIPILTSFTPSVVLTGASTAMTVTLKGTGFLSSSVIQVNNTARTTTFVSGTSLTFQLTVADQATAATLAINVFNGAPGGGTSRTLSLTISNPTPTPVISSTSPNQFIVGSPATEVQVTGTNLTTSSIVMWNGSPLVTGAFSFGAGGVSLIGQVPANLIAATGTATITVSSPTANPALSNAINVSITNPPVPTLTSISPNSGPINTPILVTLYGTGFTSASTVAYNGVTLPTTPGTGTTSTSSGFTTALTVTLPASSVATPGNGNFTVTTPAPGGGTSAPLTYTAYIGIANNSMVYNPVNGLFYVSVPSSAGAPYGNSVVSVDPATGALGTPIAVGSEPDRLAITSDGKFLWVGLDGASAVRKVDLTAGTAGFQFTLGGNSGLYAAPGTALALAALPGATDSVVVASSSSNYPYAGLSIYDSGVVRGTTTTANYNSNAYALQVDGSRNEVYAAGQSTYTVYTYSATGLTQKATSSNGNYASYGSDDLQVAGGRTYTDFGQVFDAEAGSLLGTFYSSGTNVASGPTFADTTLSKAFVLEDNYTAPTPQIQAFSTTNFTSETPAIPVNLPANNTGQSSASHLTRWGENGLVFRVPTGVVSLRSNLVKDLSTTAADLGVTLAASGSNATGANSTYVATISNAGPAPATAVTLTAFLPSTGSLVSITPSTGDCSTSNGLSCDLGGLASGASATVTLVVTQTTAGSSTLTVQVSAAENDSNTANNQASSTLTITGSTYNLAPSLTAISPSSLLSGASDTSITITGTGFTSGSTVQLNGAALSTTYTSATQLLATVPAASLTQLGWAQVTVTMPAPGGGTTSALPLTIYSVITLGVNHIVYDPYSRNIMASVGSGSSTVTGNSIVAITPDTATVGTPVNIGSQPTNLSLTSDGQILYTVLAGSESVARFNMLTQQADFTFAVPLDSSFVGGIGLQGVTAQPGTENTVALELAAFTGNAIYDFNPTTKTAAIRGQASGPYSGSCIEFLDAADLLGWDGNTLDHYTVTSSGFTYYNYQQYTTSSLNHFGCFKVDRGIAYSISGGVANPGPSPAVQLGVFPLPSGYGYSGQGNVAPDASLGRTFFAVNSGANGYYASTVDSIAAYDNKTYLAAASIPLGFAAVEGSSNTSYSVPDLIRWGQDGLAVLTTGGHIYLLRGAAVVPELLTQNSAATLTTVSSTTIAHGTGNTLLTLTGSGFLSGVAVTWNGGYRTTTIVDATHVTVAIPASDLAAAGTGSLVATNPGAAASSALSVTVN